MNIEKIHPKLRKVFGRIPSLPFHNRLALPIIKLLLKMRPKKDPLPGVKIEVRKLEFATIRIYQSEDASSGAGLLWIHGGGLIMGNAAMNDYECSNYAKNLGLVVVSVEYRLAPEYQYPAAIDDCFEAWNWFHSKSSDLGVDPSRIAIAGQSAGGGLAASLAQRIFDVGGAQPAAQVLIYPMLDDRTAAKKELDPVKHRLWNNKNNRGGWSWYLGQLPGEANTPLYAVPARRDNLSGLPSAWIGVGDLDLFYNENCEYSKRLMEAGVHCQLYTVPMAPHGFEALVPDASISYTFNKEIERFLRNSLTL